MTSDGRTGGLDAFRVAAALLVVAIHTSPLASISCDADFLLTRVVARVAVPFFLMVTGRFAIRDARALARFLKRTGLLYAAATLAYLPLSAYAGHLKDLTPGGALRLLIFDGAFYHLWYLPAAMLGAVIVWGLGRRLPRGGVLAICLALYGLGLSGDSYYGAIRDVPAFAAAYGAGFRAFSYTRNGLFYAPVFLTLGAAARPSRRLTDFAGFSVSMGAMIAEGFLLRGLGWQRHDSMYLALVPCAYFLFRLLLSWELPPMPALRGASMWIYLIHPMCIVAVRAAAKAAGLVPVLILNSPVNFAAVCALSCLLSAVPAWMKILRRGRRFREGRAWIELDRAALVHNVAQLRALLPAGCRLMPAVKADAYGHGATLVARELNRLGVRAFCVASASEGVRLRKARVRGEILVLGYTHPMDFHLLRRHRLTQTAIDRAYAEALNRYGRRLRVHAAIDTGMRRLGERCEHADDIRALFRLPNLRVTGIFTHLCVSDGTSPADRAFTLMQARKLEKVVRDLAAHGIRRPQTHLLASSGVLHCPELGGDYARVGIALYGVLSARAEACPVTLRPVLSLKARVASVRELFAGEGAGYGLSYVAARDGKIAALAIGYADGLPRALSGGAGRALIRGRAVPIVGRVCMDQTLVDVTGIPDVEPGDVAILIGTAGNETISAYDVAEAAGTITNEILSRLGARLERIVVPHG